MTKERFDLKYRGDKVAVHCDTEEKAKAFLKLANSFGYKWSSGNSLGTYVYWYINKMDTCYRFDVDKLMVDNKHFYETNNYKIIPFELDDPKETFNVGDVVTDTIIGTNEKIVEIKPFYLLQGYGFYVSEDRIQKVKPLKKITKKELAEMGYEVKE